MLVTPELWQATLCVKEHVLGLVSGDADPNAEMNVWLSGGGTHLWNPNQPQPATAWEGGGSQNSP